MKHFFFSYDESFELADPLKEYVNRRSAPKDDKALKVYYDVADIISDKRFEQNDKLLGGYVTRRLYDDIIQLLFVNVGGLQEHRHIQWQIHNAVFFFQIFGMKYVWRCSLLCIFFAEFVE